MLFSYMLCYIASIIGAGLDLQWNVMCVSVAAFIFTVYLDAPLYHIPHKTTVTLFHISIYAYVIETIAVQLFKSIRLY